MRITRSVDIEPDSVAILGYHDGTAGQVESWFEEATGCKIGCFVVESATPLYVDVEEENRRRPCKRTDFPVNGHLKTLPLIVSTHWIEELGRASIRRVLPLTPDNRSRLRQIKLLQDRGFELVSAIHPTATILPEAIIGPGVWINAGCIVGYKAELSSGVILNTGAQIDHHNVLEACCQVDPGVITAGNVALRECSHVHTGAKIINRVEIGAASIVGAGAVVVADIPPHVTAVGVPARIIKHHATFEHPKRSEAYELSPPEVA